MEEIDPLLVVDKGGQVLFFNKAASKLFSQNEAKEVSFHAKIFSSESETDLFQVELPVWDQTEKFSLCEYSQSPELQSTILRTKNSDAGGDPHFRFFEYKE